MEYTVQVVDKLSDVARHVDLSAYSAIVKRKPFSFQGAISPILVEAAFVTADLNIILSVTVVTRRRTAHYILMLPLEQTKIDNQLADLYGDTYVSGFVEGGIAVAVLSIKVFDRSKVTETVEALKQCLEPVEGLTSAKLVVSAFERKDTNPFAVAMRGSETVVSTSCFGNGRTVRCQFPYSGCLHLSYATH